MSSVKSKRSGRRRRKLSDTVVKQILDAAEAGVSYCAIARAVGCTDRTVKLIAEGKIHRDTWVSWMIERNKTGLDEPEADPVKSGAMRNLDWAMKLEEIF